MSSETTENPVIFTIGHSNQSAELFCEKLERDNIKTVIDVRSSPYSRFCPQHNKKALAQSLHEVGIAYEWMGEKLGGRTQATADTVSSLEQICQRVREDKTYRPCLMCSERDFLKCHRHWWLSQYIEKHHPDIEIRHIGNDSSSLLEGDLFGAYSEADKKLYAEGFDSLLERKPKSSQQMRLFFLLAIY